MALKDPVAKRAYSAAYYVANRARIIAATTAYSRVKAQARREAKAVEKAALPKQEARTCIDCGEFLVNALFPKRGNSCRACVSEYAKKYRADNAARIAASKKAWSVKFSAYKATQDRVYAQQNPEKRKTARDKWAAANPGINNASKKVYQLKRKKRVPLWLSVDELWMIEQAYELAALRTSLFGFAWHVDHVIPLCGKRVSGLHTPYNMQVIPWADNLRKGSQHFEEARI